MSQWWRDSERARGDGHGRWGVKRDEPIRPWRARRVASRQPNEKKWYCALGGCKKSIQSWDCCKHCRQDRTEAPTTDAEKVLDPGSRRRRGGYRPLSIADKSQLHPDLEDSDKPAITQKDLELIELSKKAGDTSAPATFQKHF
eukprot:6459248-Pyramimonas_sp.AAC.1